ARKKHIEHRSKPAPAFTQPLTKAAADDLLHRDEHLVLADRAGLGSTDADVVDLDDVGVLEASEGLGLTQQAKPVVVTVCRERRSGSERDQLERDPTIELRIPGGIDHAHS